MNVQLRRQFPSLKEAPAIFLDGPAGTQVPDVVIDAMTSYYRTSNANTHGTFEASRRTDGMLQDVREECAVFLNAEGPECISFGQNMTTLTFSLSRAFSRVLKQGDEIVITQLDHEANRGPWLALQERGIVVREIVVLPDGTLDYDDACEKITAKTKIVAAGWASNIFGTINNLALLRRYAEDAGALLVVDAVHYAPHFAVDVQAIECDILLCSAYKFYGPHVGILYCKPGLQDTLPTDRLRTAGQNAPYRIETGTLNHAAIAGVGAAIRFIASIGKGNDLRTRLEDAYRKIHVHEMQLFGRLWNGLSQIESLILYGPGPDADRTPTISLLHKTASATEVCRYLAGQKINAWDGHFYAIRPTEVLGLREKGGVTRLGIVAYNTEEEIDRTLDALKNMPK